MPRKAFERCRVLKVVFASASQADSAHTQSDEGETMIAHIHGNTETIRKARTYKCSEPEIEWSCCVGVVCGHASRTGCNADDMPVYRMSCGRHPAMAGTRVVVSEDGTLLDYKGDAVKRRCLIYGGL